MGSVTHRRYIQIVVVAISTHTLRGERDADFGTAFREFIVFQLTRSVGSVTKKRITELGQAIISTHTLRGERDLLLQQ